jgi:aconitate hydratase
MVNHLKLWGTDYVDFLRQSCLSDTAAQMALLQFMHAGKAQVAVPTAILIAVQLG